MLELKDGFVLYHGSYCEVKEPDLAKCAKRKDFGQGFYLTTSKTAYLAGAFGTEGDQEAAIECLKFVKGEKIWLK